MSTGSMQIDPITEKQFERIWIWLVKIGFTVFALEFPFIIIYIINIIFGM